MLNAIPDPIRVVVIDDECKPALQAGKVTYLGAQVDAMHQEAIQVQHEEFRELERRRYMLPQPLVEGGGNRT